MTDYSRQVGEVGEYGPAANDNGAPATAPDPAPEPEPTPEPEPVVAPAKRKTAAK